MQGKRILITGITSVLMQQFLPLLIEQGHIIKGLSRDPRAFDSLDVQYIIGDIRDMPPVREAAKNVDIIIHAAGITHSHYPYRYHEINTQGTINLVDVVRDKKNIFFVFISSRTAVPGSGAYGESKAAAEMYVQENLDNWLIVRPAEIYGPGLREGVEKLLRAIIRKRILFIPAGVHDKLYPLYITDFTKLLYRIIFEEQLRNTIVTLNGEHGYSYRKLVRYCAQVLNKRILTVPIPKTFLKLVQFFLTVFPIQGAITADQIPRLYCQKTSQKIQYPYTDIGEYLKKLNLS